MLCVCHSLKVQCCISNLINLRSHQFLRITIILCSTEKEKTLPIKYAMLFLLLEVIIYWKSFLKPLKYRFMSFNPFANTCRGTKK